MIVVLGEASSRALIFKNSSKRIFENLNEWGVLRYEISENMKDNLKSNTFSARRVRRDKKFWIQKKKNVSYLPLRDNPHLPIQKLSYLGGYYDFDFNSKTYKKKVFPASPELP